MKAYLLQLYFTPLISSHFFFTRGRVFEGFSVCSFFFYALKCSDLNMKLSLNSLTCPSKMYREKENKFSCSQTWYPAVRCASHCAVSVMRQCGHRRETNQADGKRLDVTPVGLGLEIVLIGSCCCCDCCSNTVPTGSAGTIVHVCDLCTNVYYRNPVVSCYWTCVYVGSAQNEKGDKVRRIGGKVNRWVSRSSSEVLGGWARQN